MQSLEDIPTWLSTAWSIDLVSAQIILSTAVIMALILPVLILGKDHKASLPIGVLVAFIGTALCVGLGWLPFWIMIVSVAVIALAVAVGAGKFFGD
jgi:hypothetical protein